MGTDVPVLEGRDRQEFDRGAPPTRVLLCRDCGRALPLAALRVAMALFIRWHHQALPYLLRVGVPMVCVDHEACVEAQTHNAQGMGWFA